MKRSAPAVRPFLIACVIVVVGAAGWRLLAPKTAQGPAPVSAQSGPPLPVPTNIIVFETDDQRWDTIDFDLDEPNEQWVMPNVHGIFIENGVHFRNAFVTNPTCCPSRASQLSGGFYSHNTGVLTNTWPNGSALRFEDENALAVLMKDDDYVDYAYYNVLIGKYMNGYDDLRVKKKVPPCEKVKKGRYIPPGWDIFIVVGESRDWDRDYHITVGGNSSVDCAIEGVILPDDVCLNVQGDGTCAPGDNHWENDDDTDMNLEEKLVAMDIPQDVIDLLRDTLFPHVSNENSRQYRYLPELEYLLAKAVLDDENLETPLFMMLTMAPPHGPTQLAFNTDLETLCGVTEHFCDGSQDDYTAGIDDYELRGFGEGADGYSDEDISDKPSWMQGNPEDFAKHLDCTSCLLDCYRGPGCEGPKFPGPGDCAQGDPDCRVLQQTFKDELASLHIVDCFVGSLVDLAPGHTVLFFTSDHGTMWGEHGSFQKGVPYEESIRVPFAVAGKGPGSVIRQGATVEDMIAFDLDMPATILEIAGYTRDEISDPDVNDGLIRSDGCSLKGMLTEEDPEEWGECYDGADGDLFPREEILIQSFRNLAANSTPSFAGLRLAADEQQPPRKHVITDTHEHEFYDLTGDPEAYELENLVCTDPSEVDNHRSEIAAARGLVITLDDPSIVYWDLPMGIPGEPYEVTFKAEGGVGSYSWCLWDFNAPEGCSACPDPDHPDFDELGCLFEDVTPRDPDRKNYPTDCVCPGQSGRECPCVCGLPPGLEFVDNGATATIRNIDQQSYDGEPGACYEFVLGVMDSSESNYNGEHQKYLRRFRIRTGYQLPDETAGSYAQYVSEDDQFEPECDGGELIVSKDAGGDGDGNVVFLRFARPRQIDSEYYRAMGGELILRATNEGDIVDATLYYFEDDAGVGNCREQYGSFPACSSALGWDNWLAMEPYAVPIARVCSIAAGQYVSFDITPYVTKRHLDCFDIDQNKYFQFILTSNETSSDRGFYGSGSGADNAPRLVFDYGDLNILDEEDEQVSACEPPNDCCADCRDNDCDGNVDCDDDDCCGETGCDPCP